MKNLFTLNLTTKKYGANEFLIRTPNSELVKKTDETSAMYATYRKKNGVPLWYMIVEGVFLMLGIFLLVFVSKWTDKGFERAYSTDAWALYLGAIGLGIWLVMFIVSKSCMQKVSSGEKINNFVQQADNLIEDIKQNLRIPENCIELDVFMTPAGFATNAEEFAKSKCNFHNVPMRVFREGDNLCLADLEGVWAVPVSALTSITEIAKPVFVAEWNKTEQPNSERYRETVKVNGYKTYMISKHYSVQFTVQGEVWEMLIPSYDIDGIRQLTDIPV